MESTSNDIVDVEAAQRIWREYEQAHDVSGLKGKTAGVDPLTGNIWIGDSILGVVEKRDAAGVDSLLHYIRIGSKYYYFKRWRE